MVVLVLSCRLCGEINSKVEIKYKALRHVESIVFSVNTVTIVILHAIRIIRSINSIGCNDSVSTFIIINILPIDVPVRVSGSVRPGYRHTVFVVCGCNTFK